jgi:hypothetical protein
MAHNAITERDRTMQTTTSPLETLRDLIAAGTFHHATMRLEGPTLWHGLHIYAASDSARGFTLAEHFPVDHPDADAAYELVRDHGVYEGSYR